MTASDDRALRRNGPSPGIPEATPPAAGLWRRLYWLVAGLLAAEVLAFWLLTRWAS